MKFAGLYAKRVADVYVYTCTFDFCMAMFEHWMLYSKLRVLQCGFSFDPVNLSLISVVSDKFSSFRDE